MKLGIAYLDGVRAVDGVAAHINAEVTPDGARGRCQGVGGTNHGPAILDHLLALPDLWCSKPGFQDAIK